MKKSLWMAAAAVLFLISLVPLYLIAGFDHPSVDDYFYAVETGAVWNETHSFRAVLSESFRLMKETYYGWQGNFLAIFLMRLQPGVFGEEWYWITPVILITAFVGAELFFWVTVLRRWMKAGLCTSWEIALVMTFVSLQFTYRASDSFYWYNGSIYYTFFFSLMLVLFALVTQILHSQRPVAIFVLTLFSAVISFAIGGGNFATSLFTLLILAVLMLFYFLVHRKDEDRVILTVRLIVIGCVLLAGAASFALTVLAPGNAVRQAGVGGHTGLIKTFLYSFAYGGYNIASATTFPMAVVWLALCPVFYRLTSSCKFSFRYPLLVLLFTYGLFCAQGTPVFYAQGLRIPYRMMNIITFAYYPFMAFNLFYLMGWLSKRFIKTRPIGTLYDSARVRRIVLAVALVLFVLGCVGRIQVTESENTTGKAEFTNLPLSASATLALVNGDAATYDAEYDARVALLTSTTAESVELKPFTVTPEPLFHSDITTDPTDWRNAHMEMYYGIPSIYLAD